MIESEKKSVWLDCDPGLDDTFAIVYAALSNSIDLVGVSTSPGNSSLQHTSQNALNILYNIGREDIPVYAGSNQLFKGEMKFSDHVHGENGLGGVQIPTSGQKAISQNSFEKIYHKIMSHKSKVVWANTGSLTNLCIMLLTYPDIKSKLVEIVMMGGAIQKGNITPAAEFNIFFDPHAFDGVLRLKGDTRLVMIPLEVTHQNLGNKKVYDKFKDLEDIPLAQAIHHMIVHYQEFYALVHKLQYPPFHDPLTLFYIIHPEQFDKAAAYVEVDTHPISYGRTNCHFKPYGNINPQSTATFVTIRLKNEKVKFWDQMLNLFDKVFTSQFQANLVTKTN